MPKTVAIIGGGLAGLSCAAFIKNADENNEIDITLFESSPKLGGRAYSFYDRERGLYFDNGQHILAGWYNNTLDFLDIIGSKDKVGFQKSLEITFLESGGKSFNLKCPDLPPPYNLLGGILRFKAFTVADKLAFLHIKKIIEKGPEQTGQYCNTLEILKAHRQTKNLIKYFWQPFIYAVFNASPENVSPELFTNVLSLGFSGKAGSNLLIPKGSLNEIFINPAKEYLELNSVKLLINNRINKLFIENTEVSSIASEREGNKVYDYYVSALPFFAFENVFSGSGFINLSNPAELKPSAITSIHIFFKSDIPEYLFSHGSFGMLGLIGTIAQWIFLRNKRYLAVIISASDILFKGNSISVTEMDSEKIYKLVIRELSDCITGFSKLETDGYKVIKEKRATFIPDKKSRNYRMASKTNIRNLFLAGDWTDTGLPATIEGAVKSGKTCSELILKEIKKEGL